MKISETGENNLNNIFEITYYILSVFHRYTELMKYFAFLVLNLPNLVCIL